MNEFYEYVKKEINPGIPCSVSISFDSMEIYENELYEHIAKDNIFQLITFDKYQYFERISKLPVPDDQSLYNKKIEDCISFFFKVNNQLYVKYDTINKNAITSDNHIITNMIIYSSINNKIELLKFTERVGDFLKNK